MDTLIEKEMRGIQLGRLLRISRPRFWLYEAGTFAVGVAAALTLPGAGAPAGGTFLLLVLFFLYFLIPANLFIYGINDIYDYETDKLNPKKKAYETLVMPDEHGALWRAVLVGTLPFLLLAFWMDAAAVLAFAAFLFFAWQYSAPTIRAKARPGFDSIFSAGHYVATGVFGYVLASGADVSWLLVAAGMAWAIAMHAYSAVPDIEADTASSVPTIATALGHTRTIIVCAALFISAAILAALYLGFVPLILGAIYLGLMGWSLFTKSDAALFKIYTYFPIINALAGMVIFWTVILH